MKKFFGLIKVYNKKGQRLLKNTDHSATHSDKDGLATGRSADHLDVADQRLHEPLALLYPFQVVAGQSVVLTQNHMMRADHLQASHSAPTTINQRNQAPDQE